jgi:chromosome segregation ATPase
MEADHSSINSEIAVSIARLLARRTQASDLAMKAFRQTFDTAWRSLELAGAQEDSSEEIPKLIEHLTRAVAGHVQAVADHARAEADIHVQAAVAETKRQRQEIATLSAKVEETRVALETLQSEQEAALNLGTEAAAEADRLRAAMAQASDKLTEVREEAERLRIELETERKQAATMILEVGECRMAAQQAETARMQAAAELQKESRERKALESQLIETRALLETARKEANAIRQKLRLAVAEAVKLVAAADGLEPAEAPIAAAEPPNVDAPCPPTPPAEPLRKTLLSEPLPAVEGRPRAESAQRHGEEPETDDSASSAWRRLAAMVRR